MTCKPCTAHDLYRDRLALLADDRPFRGTLAAWAERHVVTDTPAWQRLFGRFLPGEAPYARMVFECRDTIRPPAGDEAVGAPRRRRQLFAVVDVFESRPIDARPAEPIAELGWVRCHGLADDPALTTLGPVLIDHPDVEIVRYRPERRCTFRTAGRVVRYGKVFPGAAGARLHEEGLALWRASARGKLGFAVARPVAWDAERRVLWQEAVPGAPLLDRLSRPDGVALAERMGEAAGTIVTSGIVPSTRGDAAVQRARSRSYARELGVRVPALAVDAKGLGEALDAIHRERPGRARPIHGAPHVNQWLLEGPTLGLVDFDRLSMGDPELDVATFLGELDFEDDLQTPIDAIARAFVDAYQRTAGPLDPMLLSTYRAHKRLAKALRSARALRPDGDVRAVRHFATAQAALAATGGGR